VSGARGMLLAAVLAALGAAACKDAGTDGDGSEMDGSAGQAPGMTSAGTSAAGTSGGSAGTSAGGGGAGSGSPGSGSAGSTTAAGSGAGGDGGAGGSGAAGASAGAGGAGAAGTGGFALVGVCGQRGEATVDATTYSGFEEFYLIDDEGFGEEICIVRFEAERVGDAPAGCDDPTADVDCLWTHLVELRNPTVMLDTDGACAGSELALDADAIAALTGTRSAYGFVSEFAGHNSVLMKYDDDLAAWDAYGNGNWNAETSELGFDHRDGFCGY
jgi:hypothetical protein